MIFYIAHDQDGRRQIRGTQLDARSVNRDYKQIDVPTDKAGIMAAYQELFDEISDLEAKDREMVAFIEAVSKPVDADIEQVPHDAPWDPETPPDEPKATSFPEIEKSIHQNPKLKNMIERVSVEEVIFASDEEALRSLERVISARRGELMSGKLSEAAE